VTAKPSLTALADDAHRRVPSPPALDALIEDAGRQRLAAYYLYSALVAGMIGDDELPPPRWPPQLAEPMRRMGLTRFAPRTGRGLDGQLTPAEQAARRSPGRQSLFALLLVGLINQGAFGPLCGDADSVRLTEPGQDGSEDLELIKDQRVIGTCKVEDHWELVAQHLAGAPLLDQDAGPAGPRTAEAKLASQLKESGISHAVSLGTTLAVNIHPLGAAAGLGTRLVRARIRTGQDQAGWLRRISEDLVTLRADDDGELQDLRAGRMRRPPQGTP
jgi:hypothetical protein